MYILCITKLGIAIPWLIQWWKLILKIVAFLIKKLPMENFFKTWIHSLEHFIQLIIVIPDFATEN